MTPDSESPSAGQLGKVDLQVFNLELVRKLETIREPPDHSVTEELPAAPVPKVRLKQ